MTVKLYTYSGENIRVDKTDYLSSPVSFNADLGFEGNQNIESPSIIIQSSAEPAYNYAYIDAYHRYYYIISKTWLSNDLWRLSMVVDPLYTYKSDITLQRGTVLYSGLGDVKKFDPRIIYNNIPERSAISADTGDGLDSPAGGDPYIVLTCRFTNTKPADAFPVTDTPNQMTYLIFSKAAYAYFMYNFLELQDADRVAISKTFVSATVVRWLDLSDIKTDFWTGATLAEYQTHADFNSPELMAGGSIGTSVRVQPTSGDLVPFWQISSELYTGKQYVQFSDVVNNYADRQAQRLIDIPYIGQLSIDLEKLGADYDGAFKLAAEISYDFGSNAYVVTPGHFKTTETVGNMVKCYDAATCFSNGYAATFITDSSYQAEAETRTAQTLTMLGNAATGIITGIATNGATVPATVAQMGITTTNANLANMRLDYQQAASLAMNGSGNGGSKYNALLKLENGTLVRPKATLYKRTNKSATNLAAFIEKYGKPDGAFSVLQSLVTTGFCQLGTVTLTGFVNATNNEKNQIQNALLTGVIL